MSSEPQELPPHLVEAADEVIELLRARGIKCPAAILVLSECFMRLMSHLHKIGAIDIGEMHKHTAEHTAEARKMLVGRIASDGGMQ